MEEPAVQMDLVAEEGGGGHKEESKELLPAGEGMEPVEVCRLSISIVQLPSDVLGRSMYNWYISPILSQSAWSQQFVVNNHH